VLATVAILEGILAAAVAPFLLGVSGITDIPLLLPWYALFICADFAAGYSLLRVRSWLRTAVIIWLTFNVTICYAIVALLDATSLYDAALVPTVVLAIIAAPILLYVLRSYRKVATP
jgi:hypothetical protein